MAFGSWLVQEYVMPGANLRQDALAGSIHGVRRVLRRPLVASGLRLQIRVVFTHTNLGRMVDLWNRLFMISTKMQFI